MQKMRLIYSYVWFGQIVNSKSFLRIYTVLKSIWGLYETHKNMNMHSNFSQQFYILKNKDGPNKIYNTKH